MKCLCPLRCRYCGRQRSRDAVGHYCKTDNCQWRLGYSTCSVPKTMLSMDEKIEMVKKALVKPMTSAEVTFLTRDSEGCRFSLATVRKVLANGPFEKLYGHHGKWIVKGGTETPHHPEKGSGNAAS